jgi:hypothetical protein
VDADSSQHGRCSLSLRRALIAAVFGLAGLLVSGCGPLTAASVVKQGAMWAGKEVAKKGYEDYKARRHAEARRETHEDSSKPPTHTSNGS